jgi:hypothetical protein
LMAAQAVKGSNFTSKYRAQCRDIKPASRDNEHR